MIDESRFVEAQDALSIAWRTRTSSAIDTAVSRWWSLLSITSKDDRYSDVLASYALSLLLRWRSRRHVRDIDAAIGSLENALSYQEEMPSFERLGNHLNLGAAYMDRWEVFQRSPRDLVEAADQWERAHAISSKIGHSVMSAMHILPNLGDAYCYAYDQGVAELPVLQLAINCFQTALPYASPGISARIHYKAAETYSVLFERRKSQDDRKSAESHFEEALAGQLPPDEAERANLQLSKFYLDEYQQTKERSSLDTALYWARRAVYIKSKEGDPLILRKVAGLLVTMSKDFGDGNSLNAAIESYQQVWDLVATQGGEDLSTFYYNYGTALMRRSAISNVDALKMRHDDLQNAVRLLALALKVAEQDDTLALQIQLKTAQRKLKQLEAGMESQDTGALEDETIELPLRQDGPHIRSMTMPSNSTFGDKLGVPVTPDGSMETVPQFQRRQTTLPAQTSVLRDLDWRPAQSYVQVWAARNEAAPPTVFLDAPQSQTPIKASFQTKVSESASEPLLHSSIITASPSDNFPMVEDHSPSPPQRHKQVEITEEEQRGRQEEQPSSIKPTDLTGRVVKTSLSPVAEGGFASIHIGNFGTTKVAIKVIRNVGGANLSTIRKRLNREMDVWWKLDHPNIVPLWGFSNDMGPLPAPIAPWYENGNAADYVQKAGLGVEFRLQLLREVSSGLRYLHHQSPTIVHGDLKPGNVLIDNDGVAKLCDFGLAHLVTGEGETLVSGGGNPGTQRYAAPELRCPPDDEDNILATSKTDIYSLACIAYEFLYLKLPFADRTTVPSIIAAGYNHIPPARQSQADQSILGSLTPHFWALAESCWDEEPEKRPDISYFCEQIDLAFHAIEFAY